MAGDDETGICIMKMDAGLDTGAVIAQKSMPIAPSATTGDLHDALAAMGADMINDALQRFREQSIIPQEQNCDGVTYAKKIDKTEALIDWTKTAQEIDRQVRGLNPLPGAYTMLGNERIKILSGTIEQATGAPGMTLDDQLLVACGTGAYRIERMQRAGKGAMDREGFLRGIAVPKASLFGA
jgi:methionyl-tRNA formyltransferase